VRFRHYRASDAAAVAELVNVIDEHAGAGKHTASLVTDADNPTGAATTARRTGVTVDCRGATTPGRCRRPSWGYGATWAWYAAMVSSRTSEPGRVHSSASNTSTSIGPV
jgi:hypothetical protein